MTDPIWLTQARFDELTAELEQLRGEGRAEIVRRVSAARDEGDLKENSGYHAAREELGKLDGRIAQLAHTLEHAHVGEAPASDGGIGPGTKVTYKFAGDDDEDVFLLGARELVSNDTDIDVYSPRSPLGAAVMGAAVGDTVNFETPNGRTVSVEILAAEPFLG